MSEPSPSAEDAHLVLETSQKRRKLRKGTRSCWECKRRKIRCVFAFPDDETCINCRRRGTVCAGQEQPETLPPTREYGQTFGEGIAKVQAILCELSRKLKAEAQETARAEAPVHHDTPPTSSCPTPLINDAAVAICSSTLGTPSYLSSSEEAISAALIAALPCREDTETLLQASRRASFACQLMNSDWQAMMSREECGALHLQAPAMPTAKTHPVVVARLMLGCAVFLQSAQDHRHCTFSESPQAIKERLATAAIRLVTTNSELHGSLDSLECIMVEALFHTNMGNLRRAWSAYRTAIASAQLMGLHRMPHRRPLQVIDRGATFHPESMWYRIVYMERYLSLLLGLPQSIGASATTTTTTTTAAATAAAAASATTHGTLLDEPPIRKLKRSLTVVAGRILERNELGLTSYDQDQLLDSELLKISQSMPADFWRPPSYDGDIKLGSFEDSRETDRLISQVFYFYLLNHLHLPYMLSFIHTDRLRNAERHQNYSTITCANASREILVRFSNFRNINQHSLCFRPVDFTALTAGLTLLLAHLDIHLSLSHGNSNEVAKNSLAHQRLSDRVLLELIMEKLDVIRQYHCDTFNMECARLIRALLKIEAEAAQGEKYHWTITGTTPPQDSDINESDIVLRLCIPYHGDILISRGGRMSKIFVGDKAGLDHPRNASPDSEAIMNTSVDTFIRPGGLEQIWDESNPGTSITNPASTGMESWALQGVDSAFFDALMLDGLGTGEDFQAFTG